MTMPKQTPSQPVVDKAVAPKPEPEAAKVVAPAETSGENEAALLAGKSDEFKAQVEFERVRHGKTLSAAINAVVEQQKTATA